MARPTKRSVLACLTKKRLIELDRTFEIGTPQSESKDELIEGLAGSKAASFRKVVEELSLAERRAVCRAHELPVTGSKAELGERILGEERTGAAEERPPARDMGKPDGEQITLELQDFFARSHPTVQGIVPLLDRAELAAVLRRLDEQHGVRLDLATLSPGVASLAAALEGKCELGVLLAELFRDRLARVCAHYALTSDDTSREGYVRTILAAAAGITVDEARTIEAAPARPAEEGAPRPKPADTRSNTEGYRAAIAALPRGVLHRIEADLDPGKPPQRGDIVRARHRQYVVTHVVPPADPEHRNPRTGLRTGTLVELVCLDDNAQRREMERRFGIRFEIVSREHLARIRRERGATTNPWDCGHHFIVSYQTLRRPEYLELLPLALEHRGPKSLLVLDEAHNVAPASNQQQYAVDSKLTKLAQKIAPKFENRLFLSATPHNGHGNSFSALLELLDPARFSRGPIEGSEGQEARQRARS